MPLAQVKRIFRTAGNTASMSEQPLCDFSLHFLPPFYVKSLAFRLCRLSSQTSMPVFLRCLSCGCSAAGLCQPTNSSTHLSYAASGSGADAVMLRADYDVVRAELLCLCRRSDSGSGRPLSSSAKRTPGVTVRKSVCRKCHALCPIPAGSIRHRQGLPALALACIVTHYLFHILCL